MWIVEGEVAGGFISQAALVSCMCFSLLVVDLSECLLTLSHKVDTVGQEHI